MLKKYEKPKSKHSQKRRIDRGEFTGNTTKKNYSILGGKFFLYTTSKVGHEALKVRKKELIPLHTNKPRWLLFKKLKPLTEQLSENRDKLEKKGIYKKDKELIKPYIPEMLRELADLHKDGYVHSHPHLRNFYLDKNNKIHLLDYSNQFDIIKKINYKNIDETYNELKYDFFSPWILPMSPKWQNKHKIESLLGSFTWEEAEPHLRFYLRLHGIKKKELQNKYLELMKKTKKELEEQI